MPATVLGYHHFSFLVRDLDRAALFYDNGLGLTRKPRPGFASRGIWYEIGTGQELHLIESQAVADCHEGHPALEVADIQVAVAACRETGGTVQQDTFVRTHDGSLSAFVRDPDGNLIELCDHSVPAR